MEHSYGRDDGEGGTVKVCLWNQPGDDITGIIARSEKMAGTFEQVINQLSWGVWPLDTSHASMRSYSLEPPHQSDNGVPIH